MLGKHQTDETLLMIPLIVAQGVGVCEEDLVRLPLVIVIIIIIWNRRNCYYLTGTLSDVKFSLENQ